MSYIDSIQPKPASAPALNELPLKLTVLSSRIGSVALAAVIRHHLFGAAGTLTKPGVSAQISRAERTADLLANLIRELHSARNQRDRPDRSNATTTPQWRAAVDYWRAIEATDTSGATEEEADGVVEAASDALDEIVGMRAPNFAVLIEKMRIIRDTDTISASGYFDDLIADIEHLAGEA